ncbi:hypothetical protein [Paenibacillus sp. FSL K6-0108]|uniref:hypothetical protein n=1 Tax=Paenibacillus sp. FSL K6-0108 TaxID=2921417 RepID=UPI00324D2770
MDESLTALVFCLRKELEEKKRERKRLGNVRLNTLHFYQSLSVLDSYFIQGKGQFIGKWTGIIY